MANFVLLYHGGGMPQTESEREKVTKAWMDWFTKLGSAVFDPGNPTLPVAKRIGTDGKVSDVPAAALVSGYSIVKADSLHAAVELAKGCPQIKFGGQISVFETFPAM